MGPRGSWQKPLKVSTTTVVINLAVVAVSIAGLYSLEVIGHQRKQMQAKDARIAALEALLHEIKEEREINQRALQALQKGQGKRHEPLLPLMAAKAQSAFQSVALAWAMVGGADRLVELFKLEEEPANRLPVRRGNLLREPAPLDP